MITNISKESLTDAYIQSAMWIVRLGVFALIFSCVWNILIEKVFLKAGSLHGTARFATRKDLKLNGLLKDFGVICGQVNEAKVDANKKKDGSVSLRLKKKDQLVCHPGKLNTLLLAPTGSGKGVSVIIPTLLSWGIHLYHKYKLVFEKGIPKIKKEEHGYCDASIICFDPKGENYNLTAGFRSKYSRVIKFAPVSSQTCRFNPVAAIRDGDEYAYRDASTIASVIFAPAKAGQSDPNEYFINMAKDLLTSALLHVRFCEDFTDEEKSLAGVLHWLTEIDVDAIASGGDGGEDSPEVGKQQCLDMVHKPHFYRITEQMYRNNPRKYKDMTINGKFGRDYIERDENGKIIKNGIIGQKIPADDVNKKCRLGGMTSLKQNPKERASCNSEINSKLSLFNDPQIAYATSGTDFEIDDFANCDEPISLYLTVPYSDISRIAPVFRILLQLMLTKFSEGEVQFGEQKLKHNILFLLDEFPVLGTFPSLAENMGVLRGYGCFFMIVCQALNQLVDRYGQNHPFLDHCPVHVIFAPGSIADAEFYSKAIGQESITQSKVSHGERKKLFSTSGMSVSDNDFGRALLDPADIKRLDPSLFLLMVHGMQPYIGKKCVYYMDKRFTERYMPGGKKVNPPTVKQLYRDLAGLPSNRLKKRMQEAEKKRLKEIKIILNNENIEDDIELFGEEEPIMKKLEDYLVNACSVLGDKLNDEDDIFDN